MLFLFFSSSLCNFKSKLDFYEFDVPRYKSFRDNLPKNHFLITLSINNSKKYKFYKDLFIEICNDLSRYVEKNINFSYILLLDPNLNCDNEATFYIYLPGISEKEVSIFPKLSISYNTNKIINNCLSIAIELRRLEKEQKSPEIARIKEELREIASLLRSSSSFLYYKRKKLMDDYSSLTNELMQYIPRSKQKERKLRLKLQITQKGTKKYKKLVKEIQKEREDRFKKLNKDKQAELSTHTLDKINEKRIITILKSASDECSSKVFKSTFSGAYNWLVNEFSHIWNVTKNHQGNDL